MAFKKIIIAIAPQGYTGQTVKHTVTATNLKNQPELDAAGIKKGDEIDIIEEVPEEKAPVVKTEAKKVAAVEGRGNSKRAKEIADAQQLDKVFENDKGEFFTSKNLANLSVAGDVKKIITHTF